MPALTQADSRGIIHSVLIQDTDYTCLMACCAMAYQNSFQMSVTNSEAIMIQVSKKFPGAVNKETGGILPNAAQVLTELKVKNTGVSHFQNSTDLISELSSKVTYRTPAIMKVAWTGGGGHAVICVDVFAREGETIIVIIDPTYGLQEFTSKIIPTYIPNFSLPKKRKGKTSSGTLSGYVILTQV